MTGAFYEKPGVIELLNHFLSEIRNAQEPITTPAPSFPAPSDIVL